MNSQIARDIHAVRVVVTRRTALMAFGNDVVRDALRQPLIEHKVLSRQNGSRGPCPGPDACIR